MNKTNRRLFLFKSATGLGLTLMTRGVDVLCDSVNEASGEVPGSRSPSPIKSSFPNKSAPLYNTNLQTAIGLGDESATLVDKFGQVLRSRNAATRVELGSPLWPPTKAEWSQSLLDGHLPIVETRLRLMGASLRWTAFSSDYGNVKSDYIEIGEAKKSYRITLLFPYSTSIQVDDGVVTSAGKVLAVFPPPKKSAITLAKYNLLTPEPYSSTESTWGDKPGSRHPADIDSSFDNYRTAFLNRWIEYRFPVEPGRTYHVFLGVLPEKQNPGEVILDLSVNGQSQRVDFGLVAPWKPVLQEFRVTPNEKELHVKSEYDPSGTDPYRRSQLNGIWVFDGLVDPREVQKGHLNQKAVFYVQCGKERIQDIASSVVLDYEPQTGGESRWIRLPYDLSASDAAKVASTSPESARAAAKEQWDSLLQRGAEFRTGIPHLDNLYKTSLINLFLLRTKFRGKGNNGQDIYVVKPGSGEYGTFWTRDGSYIAAAFDIAGLPEEAEKSLRLFWQPNLTGVLATWGQQETGEWATPTLEWDAQGQALWTLVSHYEFTRDKGWLRTVYESIRKGALWIESVTKQTRFVTENGEKPIYFGLLPVGEGEAIAYGYNYYHNFWAVLGLRQTLKAAEALQEEGDLKWMKELYEGFSSNLLASVKLAFQRVGKNRFIPATPFDPKAPIWGSITALYPARFLDPRDPMITGTLEILDGQRQEDCYLYERDHLWTYITVEGAMCHLLRDELPMFYTLFNGYVAHASPTNAWVEGIDLPSRHGTGDMPHGWGAAEYVTIHRSSLVYENETKLELCWGVQPDWLPDGAKLSVQGALTKFGKCEFSLQRSGPALVLDYSLAPGAGHPAPDEVRFHIPKLRENITSVRVNGRNFPLLPGQSVLRLS